MIKASATGKDGRNLIILGLVEGNLVKLREGKPILVDLEPFGVTGAALIVYGETEQDIVKKLAEAGAILPA